MTDTNCESVWFVAVRSWLGLLLFPCITKCTFDLNDMWAKSCYISYTLIFDNMLIYDMDINIKKQHDIGTTLPY